MSLTNKTIGGFFWAYTERFGAQALQLIIFVVLARILTPEDFGLMGMLAVFIAVSQSLVDSGFGQALIQKKDTDETDYSSVFYINLSVSILVYGVLYFSAPLIARFFSEPELVELVRVLGLRFIIAAFSMVQITRLVKEVQFKKLMLAKLPSTLIGGIAGISAAYLGYGVWSLVIQQLLDASAYSVQIWIQSKWIPRKVFDWGRIKSLFNFGSKMMIEGVLSTIYQNLYELMIGRYFSTAQVGFYTQADKIKQIPVQNIANALGRVTFPILSGIQDNDARLKSAYKKIIRQVFFVISPIMIGAIVLAEPLFRVVLTEKWLPAVPYFQLLCISGMLYPVQSYNLNILKVKGRSDLFLYLGLIKKGVALIGIFIFVQFSVLALVVYRVFHSFFAYFVNSYYSGKFIDYGILEQAMDVWKFIIASVIAGGISWGVIHYMALGDVSSIVIGLFTGLVIYAGIIYKTEYEILIYTGQTIRNFKSRKE